MENIIVRKILPEVGGFRSFWKNSGPFKYALTSREFPPVLIEPDEWIFADDVTVLLKELMQWKNRKMKIVQAPFSKKRTDILKPEELIPWRINNFPEEWAVAVCDSFTPKGYFTEHVLSKSLSWGKDDIEKAFFKSLANDINTIGYSLLKPEPSSGSGEYAFVNEYLTEWQEDELY